MRRVGCRSGKSDYQSAEAFRLVENGHAGAAGEVDCFVGGRVDDKGSAKRDRGRHRRRIDYLGDAAADRDGVECIAAVTAADVEVSDGGGAVEQSEHAVAAIVAGAGDGAVEVDHVAG